MECAFSNDLSLIPCGRRRLELELEEDRAVTVLSQLLGAHHLHLSPGKSQFLPLAKPSKLELEPTM